MHLKHDTFKAGMLDFLQCLAENAKLEPVRKDLAGGVFWWSVEEDHLQDHWNPNLILFLMSQPSLSVAWEQLFQACKTAGYFTLS